MQAPSPTKLIVEQATPPEFAGGLFIPPQARMRPMDGTVRAVGSAVREIREGDKVIVQWQHGGTQTFEHDDHNYWLLNERQVLARIE